MSTPDEASLLSIIHRRLPPDEQNRLYSLRHKLENEQLTEVEHTELLAYVDWVEQQAAERVQALLDLANLRNVPFMTLVKEFLPDPTNQV